MASVRAYFRSNSESIVYLCVTLFGTLAPLWVALLFLAPFGKVTGGSMFWMHGEFYIYSAGLFTQSFFVLAKSVQERRQKPIILLLISAVGIVASALLYMASLAETFIGSPDWRLLPSFVALSSIGLFVISLIFVYRSDRISKAPDKNVNEIFEEDAQNIADGLASN
jgi:hypothetical protein